MYMYIVLLGIQCDDKENYVTVPLKWKIPPLISFLVRHESRIASHKTQFLYDGVVPEKIHTHPMEGQWKFLGGGGGGS